MAAPNTTTTLTAEFYDYPGGPLADPGTVTISIVDPAGTVEVATTSVGVAHPATGVYTYLWAVPANAAPGGHRVTWTATNGAVAVEVVSVDASTVGTTSGTWCTTADVLQLTGQTVTDAQVVQASAALELHLGRTYTELIATPAQPALGRRDREWLRRACAYQTVWQAAQPDLHSRLDVSSFAKSGVQIIPGGLTLAPLARRALARVSWLRSRSLHVRGAFTDGPSPASTNAVAEANDAGEMWAPLGSSLTPQVG